MNQQVVHSDSGHVVAHVHPILSAVYADVNSSVIPEEKEVGIFSVLKDHVDRLIREIAVDLCPGLTKISRLIQERPEIISPESGFGDIGRPLFMMRSEHPADPVVFRRPSRDDG